MFLKTISCFLILFFIGNNVKHISAAEYVVSTGTANFFQASAYCEQANMRLAIIKSFEDEARLYSYLENINPGTENGFWLGATNLPNKSSKVYYWLTTGAPAIYTNWLPGQPDNDKGTENCLQWFSLDGRKGWNDINCDTGLRYVCEKNWD